jgi:hypothetical protein
MTIYFVVSVIFIFSSLIFDKLPFLKSLTKINSLNRRIIYALKSKTASDYRKEQILKQYSLLLFVESIKIALMVFVTSFVVFLLLYVSSRFILSENSNIFNFIVTVQGGIVSVLSFIVYYLFKKVYVKIRL